MNNLLIKKSLSLSSSIKKMLKSAEKTLLIVSDSKKLLGILSDGDIRRAIISGKKLSDSIEQIYNRNPYYVINGKFNKENIKKIFLKKKYSLIPIVNHNLVIKKVIYWNEVFNDKLNIQKKQIKNVPLIIMAGGEGKRMKPFTNILPKPLLPINSQPIIDIIMNSHSLYGVKDFYISVNFMKDIIRSYLNLYQKDKKISYIEENTPRGTVGSLSFLKKDARKNFLVTNCDILIDVDKSDFYQWHKKEKNNISIVVAKIKYIFPYGNINLDDDGIFKNIAEKPNFDLLANTGFYAIDQKAINLIPNKGIFHMTDLIKKSKECNLKIGVYPIEKDCWNDFGQWKEYDSSLKNITLHSNNY